MRRSKVDREKAYQILKEAYKRASSDYSPCSKFSSQIRHILYSTHLTYRYILINAFLGKATNPEINPLCLQEKSPLMGAWDARTLCHKVLVPFERKRLNGALGGSNEPFLNKPARFTDLCESNAVRKGKDKELLMLLCNILPEIDSGQQAFDALSDSIYFILDIAKQQEEINSIEGVKIPTYNDIENVVNDLLSKSFGGESLVLAIGGLMHLQAGISSGKMRVEVHVVNQSGASSKEISDIDIYLNDRLINAIEAKDKVFTQEDVEHAVKKVSIAKCDRLMFITGPRAVLEGASEATLVELSEKMGVRLTMMNHLQLTKMILAFVLPTTKGVFFSILREVAKQARMKEETLRHLLYVAKKHELI